jgi:hypothetical protein
MTHAQLVKKAIEWLRSYRCGIILSEQICNTGEAPDAIGWKGTCRSVVIECKISRSDFFADRYKPFREQPEMGLGCERLYLTPRGLVDPSELPKRWGLLECHGRQTELVVKPGRQSQRTEIGLMAEMNLLLASLHRVQLRIEPQTITEFLSWKNRLAEYNGGITPQGIVPAEEESNPHLAREGVSLI